MAIRIHSYEDVLQGEMRISVAGQSIRVSVFLVDGLLVDTGPASQRADLEKLLTSWEFEQVLLTHHHEDHVGMARWIQETKDVPIWMHLSGIAQAEKPMKLPFYRRVYWGERAPFRAMGLGDTLETQRFAWDVVHTPGHAFDHVALYNREKGWVFGGDLFANPRPKSFFAFESMDLMIGSLERVLALDFGTYFCAHLGVIEDGRTALEQKLAHLVETRQTILDLNSRGDSVEEIRRQLFRKRQPVEYFSLFESAAEHLIRSVLL